MSRAALRTFLAALVCAVPLTFTSGGAQSPVPADSVELEQRDRDTIVRFISGARRDSVILPNAASLLSANSTSDTAVARSAFSALGEFALLTAALEAEIAGGSPNIRVVFLKDVPDSIDVIVDATPLRRGVRLVGQLQLQFFQRPRRFLGKRVEILSEQHQIRGATTVTLRRYNPHGARADSVLSMFDFEARPAVAAIPPMDNRFNPVSPNRFAEWISYPAAATYWAKDARFGDISYNVSPNGLHFYKLSPLETNFSETAGPYRNLDSLREYLARVLPTARVVVVPRRRPASR